MMPLVAITTTYVYFDRRVTDELGEPANGAACRDRVLRLEVVPGFPSPGVRPAKIAVIYYSATGNVHGLAQAVAAGAEEAGAECGYATSKSSPPSC